MSLCGIMESQLATLRKTLSYVAAMRDAAPCKRYTYAGATAAAAAAIDGPAIRVENRDAIEVALEMVDPLVMILADAHVPGGCLLGGGNMQEESLFRRTALFAHLKKAAYPIGPEEALYARDVAVFFDTEARGFAPLDPETRLSFVACPGIKLPLMDNRGRLLPADAEALAKKIRLIVQVAVEEGHTHLVAGAMGCGVWGCPPTHVAEIFRDVLAGSPLVHVTFAILGGLRHSFADVLVRPRRESSG